MSGNKSTTYGIAGAIVGGVIGFYSGNVFQGAMIGYSLGSSYGAMQDLKDQTVEGPRLDDLSVQTSTYGEPVYQIFGEDIIAGNVIYSTGKTEHAVEEEMQGAKGGGGGPTYISYYDTTDVAIGICEGPIEAIVQIWADTELIYDMTPTTLQPVQSTDIVDLGDITIYFGNETQTPDAFMESVEGVGNVPAYRGMAYVVIQNFKLEKFGNRLPNFRFKVIKNGTIGTVKGTVPDWSGVLGGTPSITAIDSYGETMIGIISAGYPIALCNMATGEVTEVQLPASALTRVGGTAVYDPVHDLWIVARGVRFYSFTRSGRFLSEVYGQSGFSINTAYVLQCYDTRNNGIWAHEEHSATAYYFGFYDVSADGSITYSGKRIYLGNAPNPGSAAYDTVNYNILVQWYFNTGVIDCKTFTIGIIDPTIGHSSTNFTYWDESHQRALMYSSLTDKLYVIDTTTLAYTEVFTINPLYGGANGMVYDPQKNCYWIASAWGGYSNGLEAVDAETWVVLEDYSGSSTYTTSVGGRAMNFNEISYAIMLNGSPMMVDRVIVNTVTLDSVVSTICTEAGLTSSQYDVSALTDIIPGYVIDRPMNGRGKLAPLTTGFQFDYVQYDGVVHFIKRGADPIETIPYAQVGNGKDSRMNVTRGQERDLPSMVTIRYPHPDRMFEPATQSSKRTVVDYENETILSLSIPFSDAQAAQVADKVLRTLWASRDRYVLHLTYEYSHLTPTDVIVVSYPDGDYVMRIIRINYSIPGVLEVEAVSEDTTSYISYASGVVHGAYDPGVYYLPTSNLEWLDIPALRDKDDNAGVYVAAAGIATGWPGCGVFRSRDAGDSWEEVAVLPNESVIGRTENALKDGPTTIWDTSSSVIVRLLHSGMSLTSASEATVLNTETNTAVIGNEIVKFMTVVDLGNHTYQLSNFLRGMFGTEGDTVGHGLGERFVLLQEAKMRRIQDDATFINTSYIFKAVTFGGYLDRTGYVTNYQSATALRPYSPDHVECKKAYNSLDFTISWTRRARVNGAWRDYVDVPLDESAEQYKIEITTAGGTVVRTVTSVTAATYIYTSAMMIADFGAPTYSFGVNVGQYSDDIGVGIMASSIFSFT